LGLLKKKRNYRNCRNKTREYNIKVKKSMKQVSIIIVGAGGRGRGYARFSKANPERLKIVGVAEPREFYRNEMTQKYNIPPSNVFTDWQEVADREKFADAVIIATDDSMHTGPSIAFAQKGYNILLEKPMAPTEQECRKIIEAVKANSVILGVCHVMRYTHYTCAIKKLLDSGVIGDIVSIQHLEPVGFWHQAHSFVRGNWRNEKESSPMLLAKSCHDLDWISYIMGVKCESISSFGSLKHFRKEEKPRAAGDAKRCLDCPIESECPYSAVKIYIRDRLEKGCVLWPVNVLTPDTTTEGVTKALREGPYGRCVYECDNDVVDNQVVNMLFEGGRTVSFTMTAFNKSGARKTSIFGTKGELYGDGSKIHHYDFFTDRTEVIETAASDSSILGGHGGGDSGIMDSFVSAVADNAPEKIISGPDETLASHLIVFAAEKARRNNCVVNIN
jgi:predicted dehydrogenase